MNITESTKYCEVTTKRIWDVASLLYDNAIGEIPKIECRLVDTRWAARAWTRRGLLEYNLAYAMTLPKLADYDDTIAHEIAHIIQCRLYPKAKQAHGPEFRSILLILGYSTNTYHQYSREAARNAVRSKSDVDLLLALGIE